MISVRGDERLCYHVRESASHFCVFANEPYTSVRLSLATVPPTSASLLTNCTHLRLGVVVVLLSVIGCDKGPLRPFHPIPGNGHRLGGDCIRLHMGAQKQQRSVLPGRSKRVQGGGTREREQEGSACFQALGRLGGDCFRLHNGAQERKRLLSLAFCCAACALAWEQVLLLGRDFGHLRCRRRHKEMTVCAQSPKAPEIGLTENCLTYC